MVFMFILMLWANLVLMSTKVRGLQLYLGLGSLTVKVVGRTLVHNTILVRELNYLGIYRHRGFMVEEYIKINIIVFTIGIRMHFAEYLRFTDPKIHPDLSPELSRLATIVNQAKDIVLKSLV